MFEIFAWFGCYMSILFICFLLVSVSGYLFDKMDDDFDGSLIKGLILCVGILALVLSADIIFNVFPTELISSVSGNSV